MAIGMALTATALAVFAPIADGTMTEIGVAPGDVITYGSSTGTSGTSGVTGNSGSTGATYTTDNSPVPSCPASPKCYAVTETTGFQVKVGTGQIISEIPTSGSIVAWTVSLGSPTTTGSSGSQSQTAYLNSLVGGAAQAGIAILKPRGKKKYYEYKLVAQSPTEQLQPYFGETVQFPLAKSIPVKAGEVLALSVPTWAPVMALVTKSGHVYGKYINWRSSRQKGGCASSSGQTAQQSLHSTVQYYCLYKGVRLTYSALEISTP
jgi:hypothetical protein